MRRALIVFLGALLLAALPSLAEARGRSGHGGHHGHRSQHGHGHHRQFHGGHHYDAKPHVSFSLGPAIWWAPWWGSPYPYPHHHETTVEERLVYVERAPNSSPAEGWWYYCESAGAYFPDVASCPEPWLKVPPRPDSRRSPE